jgi:hypothetical protein
MKQLLSTLGGLAALLFGTSAAGAEPSTPWPEALRKAGEALVAESGDPSAFVLLPDDRLIKIRHRSSGLVCTLPLVTNRRLQILPNGGDSLVECAYQAARVGETWKARTSSGLNPPEQHFERWRAALLEQNAAAQARPYAHRSTIEDHEVLRVLRSALGTNLKDGWLQAGSGAETVNMFFGVADVGTWRLTYFAEGYPDEVNALGPISWVSGLSSVNESRETVRSDR